ncbi:MAG: alanine racemase [Bacilli bacterium]
MYRKTYVEVDLDNIGNNVKNIINKYNNYKYYIAMVKSNAYGHGMYIVNTLIENGINYLAVSSLEEAIMIRKYNKDIPVLCSEIIDLDSIEVAINNDVTLTICDLQYTKELLKFVKNKKIKIHIKIDTGMNRLGINNKEEFNKVYDILKNNKYIILEGLYTHFATPGISDKFYDNQIDKFKEITSDIDLNSIPIIHMASSFILLSHPKIEFSNGCRIGTIIYGYDISLKSLNNSPKNILRKIRTNYLVKKYKISQTYKDIDINLNKSFKIKTNIMQIKEVKKGDKVGYGLLYTAKKDTKIATIPIGYDDGIGINHNGRYVLINNKKYSVVGEISMCMMNIEIDDSVKLSDEVIVVGDRITLGYIAQLNNTSFHNTLVNIGKKLPKVYIKNNKVIHEEEY